ncbi:hypothetical protein [Arthrobacter glacialis]|uniref:Uncharacterized protein n=1 Tax=Arthrobacter glacialis TaxID=1664 RepID=A0A2S4A1P2_ARTGL|nr:hypothetical protein [Arthrobacter glacialis]POH75294.1 hypothetical protein CVS27_01435 [Arthrobacter glacialis]
MLKKICRFSVRNGAPPHDQLSPDSSVETRTEGYSIRNIGRHDIAMRDRMLLIVCGTTKFHDARNYYK